MRPTPSGTIVPCHSVPPLPPNAISEAAPRSGHCAPTRVVLPRAGGFPLGQEWARLCWEVLPLRLLPRDSQTQEKRNQGWADRQTSARRGRGRRGRPRHSRQRPGDTRQSHGDTLPFQGTPPLGPPAPVPFLPARRLRGRECWLCPNPSGAGSRSPVRIRDSSPRGCPASSSWGMCGGAPPPIPCLPLEE